MNTRNDGIESANGRLAGAAKGVIVALLMAGAVLIGSEMNRDGALAADVPAPEATGASAFSGYFPASFPAPQGSPDEPIATF